nr:Phosphotransferase enzyme family [uncultured bacterium]
MESGEQAIIRQVADLYGLEISRLLPSQKGYRNTSYPILLKDRSHVNFIMYKSEPHMLERIKRIHSVSRILEHQGLPVRHALNNKIVKLKSVHGTSYGALYNYLPGETIPWQSYTKDHIKLTGMAMSNLHAGFGHTPNVSVNVANEYEALVKRMHLYFGRLDVLEAMREKLSIVPTISFRRLAAILNICGNLAYKQNLHMDFVRGNLLFNTVKPQSTLRVGSVAMTGILDFEKVAYGHPIFDIARTLAFLFVDCPTKSPEKIEKYFLYSGYNKRGTSQFTRPVVSRDQIKMDLLIELVHLFLVHDFYKFLVHNPYDFLHQNEHFIRTRNILHERGMIQFI